MALTQANIPSASDAYIAFSSDNVTYTAIDTDSNNVTVSDPGYRFSTLETLDGSVFTFTGGVQAVTVTVDMVFTDGETTDVHNTLRTAVGGVHYFRWTPAGNTTGKRQFTLTGRLVRVSPPGPIASGGGAIMYQAVWVGSVGDADAT